jgi:polyhydroxybutyrate depolymerase
MKKKFILGIILAGILGFCFIDLHPAFAQQGVISRKIRQNRQERRNSQQRAPIYGAGDYDFTVFSKGGKRSYIVHVPSSYNELEPMSVVLNFHGLGGNAEGQRDITYMNDASDAHGFIAVYPRGKGLISLDSPKPKMGFWNVGEGPKGKFLEGEERNAVDDVSFVDGLLNDLEAKFNVDKSRVYATGLSNGGIFSNLLACKLSSRIAAIAPVAGPFWSFPQDCSPEHPVSVIYFHGTEDQHTPYAGGIGACFVGEGKKGTDFIPAQDTVNIWVQKNDCPAKPRVTYKKGNATCVTYGPCDGGSEVVFCTLNGAGHTWPGGKEFTLKCGPGPVNRDISANDAMWDFFQKHPLKD